MLVKNISWLSQVAKEAEVTITDGNFVCEVFSQPCNVNIGDELTKPLHVFDIKNMMLSRQLEIGIWKSSEKGLGRRVVAQLVDLSNQLLAVGGIILIVDEYLPGGLEEGNLIEFECARIDLW